MTGLGRVGPVDQASGTVHAEAGASLGEVLRHVLPSGFVLPVLPGTASVTVGGALAADVHGKSHVHDGSFASHVVSFTLLLASGERRTVTPADHDVFWATAGGMGLTGIVLDAVLRLRPVQTAQLRTSAERCADLSALLEATATGAVQHRYAVAWVDLGARGRDTGRGLVETADHAAPEDLPRSERRHLLRWEARRGGTVPPGWPSGVLSWPVVRAFGEARWLRAPRHPPTRLRPMTSFFHPLDGLQAWNRVYGRPGLLQYQLAVPDGAEEVLHDVVGRVTASTAPCPLGVLKRFGAQPGFLSFPLPGWTLALDFPAGAPGLRGLLEDLDERVADCGGRVYLAKDSRLDPDMLRRMYPRLAEWGAVRDALDPTGVLISDLARRTALRPRGGGPGA
jgi:decaprenylphospho-beta-D-ribofuranose 2-oxidase